MATRSDIRTSVKTLFNRQPADIDSVLNELINTAVEQFSNMVESVNDEEIWQRTFTSDDASNDIDNWLLPSNIARVLSATHIDVTGTEDRLTPLVMISPADAHRVGELHTHTSYTEPSSYPSGGWRWDFGRPGARTGRGTVKRDGRPCYAWRLKDNLYVFPRPDTNEVSNKIELYITVKPDDLDEDSDTNTITDHYPQALIHYVCALAWFYYGQDQKATAQLQIAGKLLEEFARDDEIQKLLTVSQLHMGGR